MALDNPSPYTAQILAELETQNLVNYHTAVPDALFRANLKIEYGVETITQLQSRASLTLIDKNLTDITGVEYAKNVTFIKITDNNISTPFFISELTLLEDLSLQNNQLSGAYNLSTLSNLTDLNCSYNSGLTDVGNMSAATGLITVNLQRCGILSFDTSALTALTSLKLNNNAMVQSEVESTIDDLYANRAALGALGCAIDLSVNSGSTAAAASRATEIAAIVSAGCTVDI